ncbi:hypothetical protein ACIQOW_03980 [Kitasatospora sp. NPDC091335]|uniref:hypothetical protein n=1 Tax=Kitasatospora sp. NPDC091335 TaxID=3364085 RepID=UPI003820690E
MADKDTTQFTADRTLANIDELDASKLNPVVRQVLADLKNRPEQLAAISHIKVSFSLSM